MLSFFSFFALLFGLIVGSFLNVVIARMPENRSIVHPPSHCPACGSGIRYYDNIPVISWLILGGRCRDCKTPISSLYPSIELLTGLLAWLLFSRIFQTAADLDPVHLGAFLFYFAFTAALVAETYIDIRHYIIPDELSIYAVPFAVAGMAALHHFGYPGAMTWKLSVLGAFFGGGCLAAVTALWWLIRRTEGMGLGDVKLLALIGAVLGPWPALPFVLFSSSVMAVMVMVPLNLAKGRGIRHALPYGPFLAAGSVLWLLHGPGLMRLWLPGYEALFLPL